MEHIFFISPKNNKFLLPKKGVALAIQNKFERIDNVELKNGENNELVVKVHEREPVGVWCESLESKDMLFSR